MKKILLLITFVVLLQQVYAQEWLKNLPTDKKNNYTLYDYKQAFEGYWQPYNVKNGYYTQNGEKRKAPGWKQFNRWVWYMETQTDAKGNFPTTSSAIEYQKYLMTTGAQKSTAGNWQNISPTQSDGGYSGLGRINCIAFHPSDANTFWVGTPAGGLWKTTDGGSTWTVMTDNNAVLGVSAIAIPSDYATSNTIYIGTGDRDGGSMSSLGGGQANDNNSIGVLKSTDGGATWNATGLTFNVVDGYDISDLIINPSNNNIIVASTGNGIYRTTNGGTSWTQVVSSLVVKDMEMMPGSSSVMYAASMDYWSNPQILKSTDGGANWTALWNLPVEAYRVELAVTAANSNYVYVLASHQNGGMYALYRSTDALATLDYIYDGTATNKNLFGYYSDGSEAGGQGSYDICMAVDPTNANVVYVGGVNTFKSTDGGSTWAATNMWTSSSYYNKNGAAVVHADKHELVFQNNTTLFEGNDGGIYKTTNGGTSWTDLTNGMTISQLYRLSNSALNANVVIAGLQDNGSKARMSDGSWQDVKGGDGMECIVDYTDDNIQYATYVQGQIDRTNDMWQTGLERSDISANIPGGQPTGAWVTPYSMHPTNHNILFVGYDKVWKTTNKGEAGSWTAISQVLSSSDKLRSFAVAPSNADVMYAADPTHFFRTTDGGATNWTELNLSSLGNTNNITYITVHPTDASIFWITYGGYTDGAKVYEFTNYGANWTNISTGLPNLPVMSITVNKRITDRNQLYVATDKGVYVRDGSGSWQAFNTGLPNVVVAELEIFYHPTDESQDRLRAATFGRGLWESDLLETGVVNPSALTAAIQSSSQINLTWNNNPSNSNVVLAFNTTATFGTPVNGTSYSAGNSIAGGGTVIYKGTAEAFNHTSLTAGTNYYYKAWSVDVSNTYSTGRTASASTYYELPFNDDFETYSDFSQDLTPWTQRDVDLLATGGEQSYAFTNEGYTGSFICFNPAQTSPAFPIAAQTGNKYLACYYATPNNDWLISPKIYLSEDGEVSFWARSRDATYLETFEVSVSTTDTQTGSFTTLTEKDNQNTTDISDTWTKYTYVLSAYTGQAVHIAIHCTSNDRFALFVDNFEIKANACTAPSDQAKALSIDDAAAQAITLSWYRGMPNGGDKVLVVAREQSPVGSEPLSGTAYTANSVFGSGSQIGTGNFVVYNGNGTSVTVTGLTIGKSYYFKVYEYNSASNCYLKPALSGYGKTMNTNAETLPFTDDFENYTAYTTDLSPWTQNDLDGSATYGSDALNWTNEYYIGAFMVFNPTQTTPSAMTGADAHSGSQYASCWAATTPPNNDWLISPLLKVDHAGYRLSFWARSYNGTYLESFTVGVATSGTQPGDFTIVSELNSQSTTSIPTTWTKYEYNLSAYEGENIYIGIHCTSNDMWALFIDDFAVQAAGSVWTGAVNNSWSTLGNWANNALPTSSNDVIIPSDKTVEMNDAIGNCKNLTIMPNGSLSVMSGSELSVTGNLLVKADANGQGSLIDKGSFSVIGTSTFELFLPVANRYYYLSSPISAATAAVFGTTAQLNGTDRRMYYYDAAAWQRVTDQTTGLTPLRGYAFRTPDTQNNTFSFVGANNTGSKTIALSGIGFQLAGNPYPSAIDWGLDNSTGWTGNVTNTIWIRKGGAGGDNGGGNYMSYNRMGGTSVNGSLQGSRYIPANQAFWVYANSATTLGVNDDARVHNQQSFTKTQSSSKGIYLIAKNNQYTDEILIAFNPNADNNFDVYDSEKMFGENARVAQLYSITDNQKLAINSFAAINGSLAIPIALQTDNNVNIELSMADFNDFAPSVSVFLEDKQQNTFTNLRTDTYTFEATKGDINNRFVLHLAQAATGINQTNDNVHIFAADKNICINNHGSDKLTLLVYDITGKLVVQSFAPKGFSTISTQLSQGHYMIHAVANNMTSICKIFVK